MSVCYTREKHIGGELSVPFRPHPRLHMSEIFIITDTLLNKEAAVK